MLVRKAVETISELAQNIIDAKENHVSFNKRGTEIKEELSKIFTRKEVRFYFIVPAVALFNQSREVQIG